MDRSSFASYKGLTLVELIIDLTILGILLTFLFILIDPVKQLKRANDATSTHDMNEIKNALDTYYNDHNCYPTTLPFNNRWEKNGVTYMSKVPQDTSCESNPATCYMYQVDTTSSCPQWNILYVKQDSPSNNQTALCPLQSFSTSCLPPNYDPTWACFLSGTINCPIVSSSPVIPSNFSPDTTLENELVVTSTPVPEACPSEERNYLCSGTPQKCNVVAPGSGIYCSFECGGAC